MVRKWQYITPKTQVRNMTRPPLPSTPIILGNILIPKSLLELSAEIAQADTTKWQLGVNASRNGALRHMVKIYLTVTLCVVRSQMSVDGIGPHPIGHFGSGKHKIPGTSAKICGGIRYEDRSSKKNSCHRFGCQLDHNMCVGMLKVYQIPYFRTAYSASLIDINQRK